MRKLLIIALVLFAMVGFVTAETINGVITKVDGKKKIEVVTFKKNDEGKFDKSDPKDYDLASDVKVMKVKGGFGFGGKGFGKKKKDDDDAKKDDKKEEKKDEEKKKAEPETATLDDLTKAVEKASEGKGFFKGVFAKIETNDSGKVTSITYNTGFGGGKGGKGFGKKKKDEEKKKAEPEKATLDDLTKAVEKASEGKGFIKGVFAKIETNDSGKVTSITYNTGGGKGGKFGKKKKDE